LFSVALSYLKRFPIDKLKIDQSFVCDLINGSDDEAIVSTIINMAHTLKLKVIAVGVKTIEQLSFLQHQKCDEMQGYYFRKPMTPEKIKNWLASAQKVGNKWSYKSK
jgi:EAL domain-containing protein (putative c-di-GMP-specific phosphodiesterase class I)